MVLDIKVKLQVKRLFHFFFFVYYVMFLHLV